MMRKVSFVLNICLDGYCDHRLGNPGEELMDYFTDLMAEVDPAILWPGDCSCMGRRGSAADNCFAARRKDNELYEKVKIFYCTLPAHNTKPSVFTKEKKLAMAQYSGELPGILYEVATLSSTYHQPTYAVEINGKILSGQVVKLNKNIRRPDNCL